MAISVDLQVWIAAYIIIAYNSFFIKDTIFFRTSLALVLGTTIGNSITTSLHNINSNMIYELTKPNPDPFQIIFILLGVAVLLRLSERFGWVSRYPTSYLIGIGIAVTGGPMVFMLLGQFITILRPFETTFIEPFIFIIIMITTLTYFVMRRMEMKGTAGQIWSIITRIGRYALFWGLGLVAADTVAGFFEYVYYGYEKVLWELLGI